MFKKLFLTILFIIGLFGTAYANDNYFDLSNINKGMISINYSNVDNKNIRIMVQNGEQKAFYNLSKPYQYPLNFKNGHYTVGIFENISGTKYKSIALTDFDVVIDNDISVFLNPIEKLNWNDDMTSIKKAKELTRGLTSNKEKAFVIYNYLVKNVKYDYNKIKSLNNNYLPNPESTFSSNLGICSDFATLYAVMLRSVGVPTKMVQGYKNDITSFHAWNQVYLEDKKTWITVDITYDNTLYVNKLPYTFEKKASDYTIESEF